MKTETIDTTGIEALEGFESLKSELRSIELDVMTEGLTLADAIREGAGHTEQAVGSYVRRESNQTCALSAAMLSVRARGLA